MSHVIYNKATTQILSIPARSVGCYKESFKSEGAAKAALTRQDNKGKLGDNLVKADFAVAESSDFHANIEKTVTRKNAMTGEDFEESVNANFSTSPASENYWSS